MTCHRKPDQQDNPESREGRSGRSGPQAPRDLPGPGQPIPEFAYHAGPTTPAGEGRVNCETPKAESY